MRIGLLSDTHSYIDQDWAQYFESCDEIWHAGDFGSIEVLDYLRTLKKVRAVYGNIDGKEIRSEIVDMLNKTNLEELALGIKSGDSFLSNYE